MTALIGLFLSWLGLFVFGFWLATNGREPKQ